MLDTIFRAAEQVSTTKAAAAGGAGAGVSIAAAVIDPGAIELWLRIATLTIGLLTGLGSGGLVLLKYYDRWRGRHRSDAGS